MLGLSTSWQEVSEEVSVTQDPSLCTTTLSMQSHWSTTQICSIGTWPRSFQGTHLSLMHIASGEPDRLPSITSTTEPPIGTDTESQDTFLGTVLRTNPLCPTWSISAQRSSTEHSRGTSTPLLNLSEHVLQSLIRVVDKEWPFYIGTFMFDLCPQPTDAKVVSRGR